MVECQRRKRDALINITQSPVIKKKNYLLTFLELLEDVKSSLAFLYVMLTTYFRLV